MKIVLIRNYNPYYENGASANRFASLADGLCNNGAQVIIVVTGGYSSVQEKKNGTRYFHKGIEIRYFSKLLNHTLLRRRINKYLLSEINDKITQFRLKRLLSWDYDYLWLTNNINALKFFNANNGKIGRSLIEINEFHDIYKQPGHITNKIQLKKFQEVEALFLSVIKKIDCFAIMTNTLLEFYKPMAKASARFIHLPMTVDMSRFDIEKQVQAESRYIAYAGALSNEKDGVDISIRAFGSICAQHPGLELRLAGGWQPGVEKQKQIISQLGIEDRVKYVGLLSADQIPNFFVNADVLALPRPDSHQAQGGFPTKLGEYLATKNPVCVTRVGEIPNYLEDNVSAFMATPGDADSFADALQRALGDKENAKRVGEGGYSVAYENFNMDVQAKRFYDFLQENL